MISRWSWLSVDAFGQWKQKELPVKEGTNLRLYTVRRGIRSPAFTAFHNPMIVLWPCLVARDYTFGHEPGWVQTNTEACPWYRKSFKCPAPVTHLKKLSQPFYQILPDESQYFNLSSPQQIEWFPFLSACNLLTPSPFFFEFFHLSIFPEHSSLSFCSEEFLTVNSSPMRYGSLAYVAILLWARENIK